MVAASYCIVKLLLVTTYFLSNNKPKSEYAFQKNVVHFVNYHFQSVNYNLHLICKQLS